MKLQLLALIAIFLQTASFAQTTLVTGDILFVGFKTSTDDEPGNDCVKLVTLVTLECNTRFIVTDNNWNNSTDSWVCSDDEFGLEITCNSTIIAGSVFYIDVDGLGGFASCSGGSVTNTNIGTSSTFGTNYGLNDSGDNLFVVQGTYAAPVFISALKHVGAYANGNCSTKNTTGLPDNLSLATSAIVMASAQDQWHYNCVTTTGTTAALRAALLNNGNWTFANGQGWDSGGCMFDVTDDANAIAPSGTLAVAGAGCGCQASCNLAQWGSVNCGGGISGNCSAGYQDMSRTITVPAGCTFTVTASMRIRGGICSASGADGSCATCDVVKVDILGGSKAFQTGGANASISDSYTLAGPGTIVVSGKANRADEIITYNISMPCGASCLNTPLFVELADFTAERDGNNVKLEWLTLVERDNAYFTLESSNDTKNWEMLYVISGMGDSDVPHFYTVIDTSPKDGINYYRLTQTDYDGNSTLDGIRAVDFRTDDAKILYEINTLGQAIPSDYSGLVIQVLENGTVRKIMR